MCGPPPLIGTPQARRAGELCEAPQTAPCFHPQPFLLSSPRKERGYRASRRHLPPDPGALPVASPEGRQANGKRAEVHTPNPQASRRRAARRWLHSEPEGTDAPGPAACSPAAPAPPPILPAPQRPPTRAQEWEGAAWAAGATGVGAALLTLTGSRRLGRVPLTFGEASPGPRAPRPRARGSCGREPGAAEAPSAQQRGEAPSSRRSPAKSRSLPPWLGPFVRPSVRGALPPPPPPPPPLQPRLGGASPPRRPARGLAGSRASSLAPCPRRCRRRAERSPAGHRLPG